MKTSPKALLFGLAGALLPAWCAAVDMDFYTNNAFEETVAAFQRVALVLQAPAFTVFVLIVASAGLLVGGLLTATRGIQGYQVSPIAFMIPALIGVALFRGVVWPTGTLFIYDPVRNATQAVGDVPDAIVLMAGLLNKIERGVSETIATASADPAAERSGALRYSLLLNAINAPGLDTVLERNIMKYYIDCGVPSMGIGYKGVSQNELLRNTTDLYDTFAKFDHPSFATVYYTGAGDSSVTMTCADVWTQLGAQLNNAGTFDAIARMVCEKSGFSASAAPQFLRCQEEMRDLGSLFGIAPGSSLPFLRSIQLAAGMTNAMRSADVSVQTSALIDRQVMAEGFGVAEAMDRWVPKLRGFLIATVLGLIPLTLLFIVTPLMGKALQLMAGLFLWLSLWGVADSVSVVMAADAAADAFDAMRNMQLSYTSLLMSPEAAVQSLAVFGKARTTALMLATVLSYGLFQFGDYAFTNLAQSWQHNVQHAGEAAGRMALLPEERASVMSRLGDSVGTQNAVEAYGFQAVAVGHGGPAMAAAQRGAVYIDEHRMNGAAQAAGQASLVGGAGGTDTTPAATLPRFGGGRGSTPPEQSRGTLSSMVEETAGGSTAPKNTAQGAGYIDERINGNATAGGSPQGGSVWNPYTIPARVDAQETLAGVDVRTQYASQRAETIDQGARRLGTFSQEENLYGVSSRMDVLGVGGVEGQQSGEFSGSRSAGSTLAGIEARENIAERDHVTGAAAAISQGRQDNASNIAQSRVGDTERIVKMYETRTSSELAGAEQMQTDASAERIGKMGAVRQDIDARATQGAIDDMGRPNLVLGSRWSLDRNAGEGLAAMDAGNLVEKDPTTGLAASEAGGLAENARTIGRQSVAEQLANVEVTRDVGKVMGMDADRLGSVEGIRTVKQAEYGSQRTIVIPDDETQRDALITALQIDSRTAELLRNQPGGMRLSFSILEGETSNVALQGGTQVNVGDETRLREGFAVERYDTVSKDFRVQSQGGYGLLERPELLEEQLSGIYVGGDFISGQVSEENFNALAVAIAQKVQERGSSVVAQDSEQIEFKVEGGLRAFGMGGGTGRVEGDARSVNMDLAINQSREILTQERLRSIEAYTESHGKDGLQTEEGRAAVLHDWGERVRDKTDELIDQVGQQTKQASDGHDIDVYPELRGGPLPPLPPDPRMPSRDLK